LAFAAMTLSVALTDIALPPAAAISAATLSQAGSRSQQLLGGELVGDENVDQAADLTGADGLDFSLPSGVGWLRS